MGYVSTICLSVRIKPELIDSVRAELDKYPNSKDQLSGYEFSFKDEFLAYADITDDGILEIDESEQKWEDDEAFAEWLTDKCFSGRMEFTGEDGERWGYEFDGLGGCFEVEYIAKRGRRLILTPIQ